MLCLQQNLTVTKLNANHSGLYFCNVDNGHAFVTIPQVLIVDNVIPAFNGSGYIALPPLTQAIEHFDIEINFKPNGYDGMITLTNTHISMQILEEWYSKRS